MSSINIYKVATHLEENGWILLSNEYKNLHTPLEMMCPNKHKQTQTYEEWRKYMNCDICLAGDTTQIKKGIPQKQSNTYRILALDAATEKTGYSIYDDKVLVGYGTLKLDKNKDTEIRINEVKKWLEEVIKNNEIDFVGIEDIQLQTFNKGQGQVQMQVKMYNTLARLQGVLLDTLYEKNVPHELVYCAEWRKYCGITGEKRENKKKEAQSKVKLWYNINCTDDEADAICIGKYFINKIRPKKKNWGEEI